MLRVKTRYMPMSRIEKRESIREVAFDPELMVTTVFSKVDYRDCFEMEVNAPESVDVFVKNYFLAQPFWLRAVSFQLFSREMLLKQLEHNGFKKGDTVGAWKVYGRDEQEIAFGQDIGFMEYVFTFHLASTGLIKVATVVQYKGHLGKYYFNLVKFFHKPFVKLSLKNILRKKA
jgi:hypothetical protein